MSLEASESDLCSFTLAPEVIGIGFDEEAPAAAAGEVVGEGIMSKRFVSLVFRCFGERSGAAVTELSITKFFVSCSADKDWVDRVCRSKVEDWNCFRVEKVVTVVVRVLLVRVEFEPEAVLIWLCNTGVEAVFLFDREGGEGEEE